MKITISVAIVLACCFNSLNAAAPKRKILCELQEQQQQQSEKKQVACPFIYAPLCGTDGVTYSNKCLLCAKILQGAKLDLAYEGQCVDCSIYPPPRKGFPGDCPKSYDPVCATDGETYAHTCILCAKISSSGVQIGIRHKGKCGQKVEP